MEKEVIVGYISNYIYTSNDSLYKVCRLVTQDDDEIIIVGNFPRLEDGLNYEFVGVMKEHPKYGEQFFVESYAKSQSFTKEGLIHYLSSEKFHGIGPKLASNIVKELGLDCINIILDNPDELDKVYGLTKGKKEILIETLKNNYASEQVFIRLYGFGLTPKMIHRLYEYYGDKAANIIEENPYCLISDVEGFGFKKCDALAINLGFLLDDPRRICAAITYTLTFICYQYGYAFVTKEQLVNSVKNLLGEESVVSNEVLDKCIDKLVSDNKLIIEADRYFEPNLYRSEIKLSEKLIKLNQTTGEKYADDKIKEALDFVEANMSISYTPLQKEAIINALSHKLSIITGGPGTGKSTILNGILNIYARVNNMSVVDDKMQYKVLLVAPTGRAAKRMMEITRFKASTIHKALGYTYDGGFEFNDAHLLTYSLVVIDEASMVDIELACKLFTALPNTSRVIMVGDANQLPSVGPGNVLHDLMKSKLFKTTILNQIMRQASDSNIVSLSHMVLSESIQYNIFSSRKDIFYYNYEAKNIADGICKMLDNFISSGGDLFSDIQILIPMYAGVAGIDAINAIIQEKYNPETEKFIKRDELFFKKNDKVLQLKNDSELDIMNGDIGKILDITTINDKDALLIDFDGRVVTYYAKNLENLKLGYAISIHKSQGSEFKNVIMPILPSYQIMLKKKIIYTGITRAKEKLIILGKLESLDKAIHTPDYQRQTTLYQRVDNDSIIDIGIRIFDSSIPFDTFGEYDMEGITPYTFMND